MSVIDSPRINWPQVWAILIPGFLSFGLMIATGTWAILSRMSDMQHTTDVQNSSVMARLATDEARIDSLEKVETSHYAGEVAFQTEMRQGITSLANSFADLRVVVGSSHERK